MAANKPHNQGPHNQGQRGYQNAQPAAPAKPVTPQKKSKFWPYTFVLLGAAFLYNKCSGPPELPEPPKPTYTPNRDAAPLPPQSAVMTAPATTVATDKPATAPREQIISRTGEAQEEIIIESAAADATGTDVTGADRAQAFNTIMSEIFQASAYHQKFSPSEQATMAASVAQMMSGTSPEKAFYGDIYERHSGERTYVAAAPMGANKIAQAFICTQSGSRANSFYHATAIPDHAGGYNVNLSETIQHAGYLRGQHLMKYYGNGHSCTYALQAVDIELNGSAETAAVNVHAPSVIPR